MKIWTEVFVNRLRQRLEARHQTLVDSMVVYPYKEGVRVDSSRLRIAVDDYNTILKEIKRLA